MSHHGLCGKQPGQTARRRRAWCRETAMLRGERKNTHGRGYELGLFLFQKCNNSWPEGGTDRRGVRLGVGWPWERCRTTRRVVPTSRTVLVPSNAEWYYFFRGLSLMNWITSCA